MVIHPLNEKVDKIIQIIVFTGNSRFHFVVFSRVDSRTLYAIMIIHALIMMTCELCITHSYPYSKEYRMSLNSNLIVMTELKS